MDTINGYVNSIVFRNAENGYTVFELISDDEEIVCIGNFHYLEEGELMELHGSFVEHPLYGKQFKTEFYEIKAPEDLLSIERYLGSGAIKGIGASLAARIVKKFKTDTIRILEEEPERLVEIKGISERKAREIAQQTEEKREMRKAMIFLQKYKIGIPMAVKIYEQYGNNIYKIINENPYQLADDITGIGFRIADEIANNVGIQKNSDFRIRSGLLYVLLQSAYDGHVYLPKGKLMDETTKLLEVEADQIELQLRNLAMDKKIIIKENDMEYQIYSAHYYYMELNCARMLHDLNRKTDSDRKSINKTIGKIEESAKVTFDDLQRQAIIEASENGVLVVTGGPGTGKTTTINAIIKYFLSEGLEFYLAAPTGRAAKRMTETTGFEAQTIHRMLELTGNFADENNNQAAFERNEQNPLEADAIIIDEMSMVDIALFYSLLKAITVGTRLILVGDVNQLPSVGAGSVLKDIISSKCITVVELNKIFRQASDSDIVINAHKINRGISVALDNKSRDFFFLKRNDVTLILRVMLALIQEKLPKYVNAEPFDIQVLTPMRKGLLGVENLNKVLQKYLNPAANGKREKEYLQGIFREGDKVMQIKNNYQIEWEVSNSFGITVDKGTGVFNGDMGIIKDINLYEETLTVLFDEEKQVVYPFKQLDELELSYAITIHKSQGSEYPAVILPILTGPKMLMNRNILYTGVTRARKCVTIIGSEQAVDDMIKNENEQKRYSGLKDRIKEFSVVQKQMETY